MRSRRQLLCVIFPKLFFLDSLIKSYQKFAKMKFPIKIAIGCGAVLILFVIVGFVAFPHMITGKVKTMVTLDKDSDIRKLFVKVPFGLGFNVYLFNVTNPDEVQSGKLPAVQEVGPFCYSEWKEKVNVTDLDEEDAMFYQPMDTFYPAPAPGCMTGQEMITIPHPLILGMVNAVVRTKPAMLNLVSKALNAIYRKPTNIFLTAKATDILFDGVIIDCNVKDFAGKAVCSQLKETPSLRKVSENELAFALMWAKNHTPGEVFKVNRGVNRSHDVGLVVEYDGNKEMDTWPTHECNQYKGTDGTIFPPFLKKEEGLASFSPDLCRSLVAEYKGDTEYNGIPVRIYTASLGDQTNNPEDKCYCPSNDTCLKKGIMDLFKCGGVPIYASLPHFYDSDESYVKGVVGLKPNETNHGIQILFEGMTGSPVSAAKRLMFSMPLEPNEKIAIFNNLPTTILPLFWVEESINLNSTLTKPLKDLFSIMKIVKITSWVAIVACMGGLGAAAYLYFKKSGNVNITPVHKVAPNGVTNGISTVGSAMGHSNKGMSVDEPDKF